MKITSLIGLFLLCLFLLRDTAAQSLSPNVEGGKSVREILLEGITKRSPLGRYVAGDFSPGVKLFGEEDRCVQADLKNIFLMQQPPMNVVMPDSKEELRDKEGHINTRDLSINIKDFEEAIVKELERELSLFNQAGDLYSKNRELCIDAVVFERPNAVSIGLGYLAFDPNLFFQIARSDKANEWSMRAIIAHEFAHQLQIWTNDPTLFKTKEGRISVRDKELQADCVAAGVLSEQAELMPTIVEDDQADLHSALVDAFVSLGDFEIDHFEGHHGTAYERSLMVTVGINKAAGLREKDEFGSVSLLEACRDYIDAMNAKFGEVIWPIGSVL